MSTGRSTDAAKKGLASHRELHQAQENGHTADSSEDRGFIAKAAGQQVSGLMSVNPP
jgi:hypothetical protein